jgi:hypothetical protein
MVIPQLLLIGVSENTLKIGAGNALRKDLNVRRTTETSFVSLARQ